MKTKISRILGVSLALVMVFSLFGVFAPVKEAQAQAYTANQWNAMSIPSWTGQVITGTGNTVLGRTNVIDFAVGPDGKTIYAIVSSSVTAAFKVLKSTNAGCTWSVITTITAPVGNLTHIAVSPVNPQYVVYVDAAGGAQDIIYYSRDGGATWVNLNFAAAAAAETINGIDISGERFDALLGRDFVVCTSNAAAGTGGDIYILGTTNQWTAVGPVPSLPIESTVYDYTSVLFEPNWLSGRSVVAVASDNAATPSTRVIVQRVPPAPAPVDTVADQPLAVFAVGTWPEEIGGLGTRDIVSSCLALPIDFDSFSSSSRVAYVGLNSAGAAFDDVYRCTSLTDGAPFGSTYKLGISANTVAIWSIAFNGSTSGGTLLAGEFNDAVVWKSTDPQTNSPSWNDSSKMSGGDGLTVVRMPPDYNDSRTAYAGTSGNESAFHRATDGGKQWNHISLIDIIVATLDDVMPAPDNSAVFMTTTDNVRGRSSIWRSPIPSALGTWEKLRDRGNVTYILRLSPDYLTDSTVYACEFGGTDIQVSNNKGQKWSSRVTPVNITGDVAVESQDVLYMAAGIWVYRSTNGGGYFETPIDSKTTGVYTLAMAPSYPEMPKAGNVLAGGVAGEVTLSTDSGASFTELLTYVPGATNMQVFADKDYATTNIVYAGGATTAGIYRYTVGATSTWTQISATPATTTGLTGGGSLYASDTSNYVRRSLYPATPNIAAGTFDTMNINSGTSTFNRAPSALRAGRNATDVWLWAIDTAGAQTLMAYNDSMAKAKVVPTVPASVGYDAATGLNAQFVITWPLISNATQYAVEIFTNAACTERALFNLAFGPPDPLNPAFTVTRAQIPSGVDYYVRVFINDQAPLDAIRSLYDPKDVNVVKFSVTPGAPIEMPGGGPTLLSPTPGNTAAPLRPGFSWSTMLGATEYEFILATDSALTKTIAGTPVKVTSPSFSLAADLSYSTTYFYAAKVTKPTAGPQSIGSFTTMAQPVVTPPITIPPVQQITPGWIYAIIAVGGILVIVVIVLIMKIPAAR